MIAVIGGGPAGRLASIQLALEGKEVMLIDKRNELGGQCLHKGCMVICALNDIARIIEDCKNLQHLGVFDNIPAWDYSSITAEMRKTQERIAKVLDNETKESGVDVICGEAAVKGKEVILDGVTLKPDNIIIATGSVPAIPDIGGTDLKGVYTPHTITRMEKLPEKIAIIGGGVIAAEYAYIFSSLGVETIIISRSSFLRGKPEQLVKAAKKELDGADIKENAAVRSIAGDREVRGIETVQNGVDSFIDSGAVLIATGLKPNSSMISGVKKGAHGEIIVSGRMETDVPGVYAAGDVTGPPYLTPVARLQGIIAADSITGRYGRKVPSCIPQAIRLRYEHSFFETDGDLRTETGIPAPAGPGSFWYVHEGNTGRAMVSAGRDSKEINGAYLGSPGSGPALAYLAHLTSLNAEIPDFSEYLEIHPSTDGIPYIIKYLNRPRE